MHCAPQQFPRHPCSISGQLYGSLPQRCTVQHSAVNHTYEHRITQQRTPACQPYPRAAMRAAKMAGTTPCRTSGFTKAAPAVQRKFVGSREACGQAKVDCMCLHEDAAPSPRLCPTCQPASPQRLPVGVIVNCSCGSCFWSLLCTRVEGQRL